MVTPLIALAALLSPTSTNVTLTVAAAPVPDVVKQIAEATGADLRVAPGLAELRVGVRLQDVPLETVKAKLAEALRAEWKPEDTGLRLTALPAADVETDREAEIQAYLDRQPALAPFGSDEADRLIRDAMAVLTEMGDRLDWARIEALAVRTPIRRANLNLFRAVGAPALAALKEGDRVVYSTAPTRIQRPLTPAMRRALDDLRAEQAAHREALLRLRPHDGRNIHMEVFADDGPDLVEGRVLHLALSREWDQFSLRLVAFDERGAVRGNASTHSFNLSGPLAPAPEPPVRLQGSDAEFKPTDTARAFAALRPRGWGSRPAPVRSPEDRALVEEALSDMVQHEPIAWGEGEVWRQAAENHGLNMVAVFPDVIAYLGPRTALGQPKTDELMNDSLRRVRGNASLADGWLVLRAGPSALDEIPLPRRAVSTFVRASVAQGGPRLDPLADLVGSLPADAYAFSALEWPRYLWPEIPTQGMFQDVVDFEALRLYSQLDADTRRRARRPEGVTVRYGQMNGRSRAVLDRMLFSSDIAASLRESPADFDAQYLGGSMPGLAQEPTVAFAEGVPPMATITFRIRDRGAIYARRPESGRHWPSPGTVTTYDIAQDMTLTESPSMDAASLRGFAPYDRFAVGTMEQLEVSGAFGGGLFLSLRFQMPATPPADQWVGFDGLPEAIRQEVLEKVDAFRKHYDEVRRPGQPSRPPGGARPLVP